MKGVMITGGAGFIGSHLAQHLLQLGHEVIVIDDLNDFYSPEFKRSNLACIRQTAPFHFYECDICKVERISQIVDDHRPEIVIDRKSTRLNSSHLVISY